MVRGSLLLALSVVLAATPAYAEIARVKSASGIAAIQRGTARIPAATGAELQAGDLLVTGKDGRISLTFIDNTRFAVGPNSRIAVSKF